MLAATTEYPRVLYQKIRACFDDECYVCLSSISRNQISLVLRATVYEMVVSIQQETELAICGYIIRGKAQPVS